MRVITTLLIIAAVFTCIVAVVGTLLVGKEVSSQQKQYEDSGDTLQNEIERSLNYEKTSLKVNIKSLTWIYIALAILVLAICLGIFFY